MCVHIFRVRCFVRIHSVYTHTTDDGEYNIYSGQGNWKRHRRRRLNRNTFADQDDNIVFSKANKFSKL